VTLKIKNKGSLPESVLDLNWQLTRHVLEARGTESFETADLTVAVEDLSRLCAVFAFSCPCHPPTVYPGTDIFLEEKNNPKSESPIDLTHLNQYNLTGFL